MCDVSKGGGGVSPEKRTYDVSRGHNRYVRLPLVHVRRGSQLAGVDHGVNQ